LTNPNNPVTLTFRRYRRISWPHKCRIVLYAGCLVFMLLI